MKENARQGFWNGAMAPLGYKVIEAEKRGSKIKKKVDIDPVEAETVRLIFNLYLNGDGKSGSLGVKEIVKWLNARGYRTRSGQTFGVGSVHRLLTNTTYIGRLRFNQTSSRTGDKKPDGEAVEIAVPAIVGLHVFEQVQRQLHARSPKVVAPRVTPSGRLICSRSSPQSKSMTRTSGSGGARTCSKRRSSPAKKAPPRVRR
jgi:site-specific DNA recombinase